MQRPEYIIASAFSGDTTLINQRDSKTEQALSLFRNYKHHYQEWSRWTVGKDEVPVTGLTPAHLDNLISFFERKWLKPEYRQRYISYWHESLESIFEDARDEPDAEVAYACYGSTYEFAEKNLELAKAGNILCLPFYVMFLVEKNRRESSCRE